MVKDKFNDKFQKDLHKFLLEENKNKDKDYYGNGLHASSIGYCKRKAVYEYYRLPCNDYTLNTLLTFDFGNYTHKKMEAYLKWSKVFQLLNHEVDISGGLPEAVKGRYDFRITDRRTKKIILGDTKTANSTQIKKYKLPKDLHEIQLNIYGYACNNLNIPFDEMRVFYFDKETSFIPKSYVVEQISVENLIKEYIEAINRYAVEEELPEVITDSNDKWKCNKKYCVYKNITCNGYIEPPKEEDSEDDFIKFCDTGV